MRIRVGHLRRLIAEDIQRLDARDLRNSKHDPIQYAKTKGLKQIGRGSSRHVFLISPKYVLKAGTGSTGYAQNETEVDVFTDPRVKPVVARIVDFDSKYKWLISELVRPLKNENEFAQLTGLGFGFFATLIRALANNKNQYSVWGSTAKQNVDPAVTEPSPAVAFSHVNTKIGDKEQPSKHEHRSIDMMIASLSESEKRWIDGIIGLMKHKSLLGGDIARIDHWGKTADGRVVLLDYGLDSEVFQGFYDSWGKKVS